MTIKLGCFDSNVANSACEAYVQNLGQITRLPLQQVKSGLDKFTLQKFTPPGPAAMSIAEMQKGLQAIGFFPVGQIDGICGYRTQSAVRLFQEYVRSVEKLDDVLPDGQFGPATQAHLQRWMAGSLKSKWTQTIERFQAGTLSAEYSDWLALLENVKQQYLANPNKMLLKVNGYVGATCTSKVAQWDFKSQSNVHLIGIRRDGFKGKFEDIFVLLINGLVFKFQGSTDPGAKADARGYPFLVQGQHDYHFGWHKETYLALRPQSQVLVIRTSGDQLTDADLNKDLEPNETINIHWGGPGMTSEVGTWSEGCQVINGSVYCNAAGDLINCSKFAATGSSQPLTDSTKTRGAYNVLVDLVTTMTSDQSSTLKYMMLIESDLDLSAPLKSGLADLRNRFLSLLG
jgi:peptidoglycan hydrolase-like protein with peptidoglycan-binding domain